MCKKFGRRRVGVSLAEMLAAAAIVGIVALVVVPRLAGGSGTAKRSACHARRGNIEMQAQLWYRNKGGWPLASLGDIGADVNYFPEGLKTCPVDGSTYTLDTSTGRVIGHDH